MKKILISLLLLFPSLVSANSIDFYGEKDSSWGLDGYAVESIKQRISDFQDKTELNTDIVILGKNDDMGCYLEPNFDSCVKQNYGYAGDIVIVLKMKSDISSRGDIRSYMDNKNEPILTPNILKQVQDSIVYNFKSNDFRRGILEYYDNLEQRLFSIRDSMLTANKEMGGDFSSGEIKISTLKNLKIENDLLLEKQKKEDSFYRIIYILISFLIFVLGFLGIRFYYISKLKSLLSDLKYRLLDLDKSKNFEQNYEKTKKDLDYLIKKLEIYLGDADKNWLKLRKYYKDTSKQSKKILDEFESAQKNFNSQEELNNRVEDFKNINI